MAAVLGVTNMEIAVTVAIRTYNGAERLSCLLNALQQQNGTEAIAWEILIVDNTSRDRTAALVRDYQQAWPLTAPLRYCTEPRQGAGYARQRCIQEARGAIVAFLDDDTRPTPHWLAAVVAFGRAHPEAGAYGSRVRGDYEVPPPPNFDQIAPFLAINERGDQPHCYTSHQYARQHVFPPGAGLAIRRQAWLDCVPERLVLQGPIGQSLVAKGEDLEALSYLARAGWEVWYNPAMEIYHRILAHRFERDYLLSLCRGIGLGRHCTRMLGYPRWQRPGAILAYFANDLRKAIAHLLKHRQALATDTVAAAQLQFLLAAPISPLFVWRRMWMLQKSPLPKPDCSDSGLQ